MEAEFTAIIEKNLPAQVGDVLKKRLDQANNDASKVKQLEEQLGNRNQHVTKLEAQIADYKKFDERNSAIEAREKACDTYERDLKVKTLEYQLQSEREKTQFSKEVALGLVRNTEYTKKVFDTRSGPDGIDQYGNQRYATHTVNVEETKKAE
jgi:DNA repair exonuclease SbcCD ATPase subunit